MLLLRLKSSEALKTFLFPFLGGLFLAISIPLANGQSYPFGSLFAAFSFISIFEWEGKPHLKLFFKELFRVFFFCLGYYLLAYSWLPTAFSSYHGTDVHSHLRAAQYSLIALPGLWSFLLVKQLLHFVFSKRKSRPSPFVLTITVSTLFTLCEAYTPYFIPVYFGHGWLLFAPYLGMAPVLGASGYTFFTFLWAFIIYYWLHSRYLSPVLISSVIVFVLLNIFYKIPDIKNDGLEHLSVRLVQPNIKSEEKILSEAGDTRLINEISEKVKKLTAVNLPPTDFIVWPETAWPLLVSSEQMKTTKDEVPTTIKSITEMTGAYLLWGGYDISNSSEGDRYNSAFLSSSQGKLKEVFHKHLLVPFGEGLPFGPLNFYVKDYYPQVSFYARGDRFPLFEIEEKNTSFVSVICYEILFSSFMRKYLLNTPQRPNFIANISNDSWYGDTSEPRQHHFLARWRALEFNLPLLRLSNSGLSALILPNGKQGEVLEFDTMGTVDLRLPIVSTIPTIYQRYGYFTLFLVVVFITFCQQVMRWRR